MAEVRRALTVVVSETALSELWDIWRYNAERYDFQHAEGYEGFLNTGINGLATSCEKGNAVEGFPELRSLVLKRSRKGDGHVVIYQVDIVEQSVQVLHVYHTKMDVQGRLRESEA